jgi:predicted DNA-binding helix-hairpin-helix protein
VSVNIEATTAHHLEKRTLKRDIFQDILERIRWVKQLKAGNNKLPLSGQTTQFVVAASSETDRDVLRTTTGFYREVELTRDYLNTFQPIAHYRLDDYPPTPLIRDGLADENLWVPAARSETRINNKW